MEKVTKTHLAHSLEKTVNESQYDDSVKALLSDKQVLARIAQHRIEEFWDYDSSATSRTVDVYMAKIREKTSCCDGFEILTVHGLGYKAVLK